MGRKRENVGKREKVRETYLSSYSCLMCSQGAWVLKASSDNSVTIVAVKTVTHEALEIF